MNDLIYYYTTEQKTLSGDNRELIKKLRSGLYPAEHPNRRVIINDWENSQDMINMIMRGCAKVKLTLLIDEDHPQIQQFRDVENPKYELNVVKDGVVDLDIDSILNYIEPVNSCIVLSPSSKLTNHKDFRKAEGLVLLYKHSADKIEDLASEGLLTRVLLANVEPITFVWHCGNLPKDITDHGVKFLNNFFKKHYPESDVKIILKDVDCDHIYGYLVQNIL